MNRVVGGIYLTKRQNLVTDYSEAKSGENKYFGQRMIAYDKANYAERNKAKAG